MTTTDSPDVPRTHCAECNALLIKNPRGVASDTNLFPGELINDDASPHRLTCNVGHRYYRSSVHSHRCDSCGDLDCLLTLDRKGQLHRCKNPACGTWRYQSLLFRRSRPQGRFTL